MRGKGNGEEERVTGHDVITIYKDGSHEEESLSLKKRCRMLQLVPLIGQCPKLLSLVGRNSYLLTGRQTRSVHQ